jgi:hypothetical protein
MPLSTDVRLPKGEEPKFPDRCVACGRPEPGARFEVSTRTVKWWTLMVWEVGERFSVQVPACPGCVRRFRARRRVGIAAYWLFCIAGVGVARLLLGDLRGPLRELPILGIALALMMPYFLWQVFHPPVLELTAYSKAVEYEFRDRKYAEEFAALNGVELETEPAESAEPPAE